jgi:hypothetical protein
MLIKIILAYSTMSLCYKLQQIIFMFAACINSIKAIPINPTDAHNYKITGMLKQSKFPQLLLIGLEMDILRFQIFGLAHFVEP